MDTRITLKIGEGCGPIATHMHSMGIEFAGKIDQYPRRTAKNRHKLEPYMHREFCDVGGSHTWQAWAYHTSHGVTVCSMKMD